MWFILQFLRFLDIGFKSVRPGGVAVVTRLRGGWSGVRFVAGSRDFCLLKRVQSNWIS